MTALDVQGPDGATGQTIELPAAVFDAQANISLMHQVVVAQLAARRSGTHKTKTRGEVSGGGAKPYRQKGTGRARQGSTRAPQFEGGGVVHGPVPRDYSQRTPKKMKAAALRGALSDRARDGRVHVVEGFGLEETPSTKTAKNLLGRVLSDGGASGRVLVVLEPDDVVSWKSLRNVTGVHLLDTGQLNTYDVLVSDDVVFTQAALETFVRRASQSKGPVVPDLSTPHIDGDVPSVVVSDSDTTDSEMTDSGTTDGDASDSDATDSEDAK